MYEKQRMSLIYLYNTMNKIFERLKGLGAKVVKDDCVTLCRIPRTTK